MQLIFSCVNFPGALHLKTLKVIQKSLEKWAMSENLMYFDCSFHNNFTTVER